MASAAAVLAPPPPRVLAPAATHRPTRAIVDIGALRHNLDFIRNKVGRRTGIMAVVKADAYGHGMVQIARECVRWGVQGIAVATVDEALTLRETRGFEDTNLLLAGPSFLADAEALQDAGISVAVGSLPLLRYHLALAEDRGRVPRLHLKIDSGMGRYGFRADKLSFLDEFARCPEALEGVMTHFSVSDGMSLDEVHYTDVQRELFERVVSRIYRGGMKPVYHAANSGAVLYHPATHYELVRPGVLLYGAKPNPSTPEEHELRQVMTLATRIVSIGPHRAGEPISYGRSWQMPADGVLGIIPVGYGDGMPRSLGNRAHVLVHGRRVPIRGRVCMDQTMIDLSTVPEARVGDEVVVYGEQAGERISLEEVAMIADTIPYEITCQLGGRVPRVWVE